MLDGPQWRATVALVGLVILSKRDVDAADDEDHHDLGATDMAALIQTLMVWRAHESELILRRCASSAGTGVERLLRYGRRRVAEAGIGEDEIENIIDAAADNALLHPSNRRGPAYPRVRGSVPSIRVP